jgi:DNA-binding beta-propeller fold protein YncE
VFQLAYDNTGVPSSLGAPKTTGNTPLTALVDPTGTYLYVANANDTTISAFPLDATTGALGTVVTSQLLANETGSRGLSWEPGGKYLVLSGDSKLVTMLSIGAGGTVTPLANAIDGTAGVYYDPVVVAH